MTPPPPPPPRQVVPSGTWAATDMVAQQRPADTHMRWSGHALAPRAQHVQAHAGAYAQLQPHVRVAAQHPAAHVDTASAQQILHLQVQQQFLLDQIHALQQQQQLAQQQRHQQQHEVAATIECTAVAQPTGMRSQQSECGAAFVQDVAERGPQEDTGQQVEGAPGAPVSTRIEGETHGHCHYHTNNNINNINTTNKNGTGVAVSQRMATVKRKRRRTETAAAPSQRKLHRQRYRSKLKGRLMLGRRSRSTGADADIPSVSRTSGDPTDAAHHGLLELLPASHVRSEACSEHPSSHSHLLGVQADDERGDDSDAMSGPVAGQAQKSNMAPPFEPSVIERQGRSHLAGCEALVEDENGSDVESGMIDMDLFGDELQSVDYNSGADDQSSERDSQQSGYL